MSSEEPKAWAGAYDVRRAIIENPSLCGLTLGDLRKVVAAPEGMPDKSEVRFEKLSKSYVYVDEWYAKRVNITHEESR
jgi:hypothetical protein